MAQGVLKAIEQVTTTTRTHRINAHMFTRWRVPAEEIAQLLTEVTAFGHPLSERLLSFISTCNVMNATVVEVFERKREQAGELNFEVEWDEKYIVAWRGLCAMADDLVAQVEDVTRRVPKH